VKEAVPVLMTVDPERILTVTSAPFLSFLPESMLFKLRVMSELGWTVEVTKLAIVTESPLAVHVASLLPAVEVL
jgi:hypothetical protein